MGFVLPSSARTKVRNAGWLLAERGVGVAIAFFIMTLVARELGPAQFGAYAYLFSVTALLAPLAHFGLTEVLVREAVARPDDRHVLFGSAMALSSIWALASVILGVAIISLSGGPPGVTPGLMALAATQLLVIPVSTTWAWFKADERLAPVVLPRLSVVVMIAGIALYMVYNDVGLGEFVALRAFEQFCIILSSLAVFSYATSALHRLRVSWAELCRLFKTGLPLMLAAFATVLYMRIDQVMLGQMSAPSELGQYGLAVRVSDVALVVPLAMATTFFASIVRAEARGTLAEQGQRLYDAMILTTLLAALVLSVAVWFLFAPVFGQAYAPGVWPTLILLLGLPLYGWGIAREHILLARRLYWLSPLIALTGAVLNIGLNFILIPSHGGVGAAVATVATFAVTSLGAAAVLPALRRDARAMIASLNLLRAGQRLQRALVR